MYKQTFQMLVTEASDKSVQQHPDDFFCWGSLCNTVVSSLGSTFWLNILATTQSAPRLENFRLLKNKRRIKEK